MKYLNVMGTNYYDPDRVIDRRNERLANFFSLFFAETTDKFRLIGDRNCPAVIVNESVCLSCFVKNFDLNFTDKPSHGDIVETVKLQKEQLIDFDRIDAVINKSEHRKVFKIKYPGTDLYLSGYNFEDKIAKLAKYPVFSRKEPKIYFNEVYAKEIIESFPEYELLVE
jgi:hypothetical protein